MKALGSQIIAEFIHCHRDILNHKEELEALLKTGIERYDLKLKALNSYQFDPVGVTAIAIIGESHVALHTYPEAQHLSLDIFTCSPGSPNPQLLMNFLKEALEPEFVRYKELNRGLSVELVEQDYVIDFTKNSFDIRYHIDAEILRQRTQYQNMVIIDNKDFGRMLFLDQELQIAEHDAHIYNSALIQPILEAEVPLHKVAILGGGDGGVLHDLLQKGAQEVYLVDIDGEVVEAAKTHLQCICGQAFDDPRAQVCIQEARSFIQAHGNFDALIYDLTMSPEVVAHDEQESYFPDLFAAIYRSLKAGGVLTLQISSPYDHQSFERAKELLEAQFSQVEFKRVFIPSFGEDWVFAQARKMA